MTIPTLAPAPDPDLRRRDVETLVGALRHTIDSSAGQFVFCVGPPGVGRTTLLAQFVETISGERHRPAIVAGGFGLSALGGAMRAWKLPVGRVQLMAGAVIAGGLGQLVATAAAGAGVASPAGAARLFTSLAAFVGQALQAGSFAAQASEQAVVLPDPGLVTPSAVFQAISAISEEEPVVVVLDDLHAAFPGVQWCTLLIERWLAPLIAERPILFVASALEDDAPHDESGAPRPALAQVQGLTRAHDLGGARVSRIELTSLDEEGLRQWLGPVDVAVTQGLLACAGGHPGWTVSLFRHWVRQGAVRRGGDERGWEFAQPNADLAAESARSWVKTILWRLFDPDVDAYARAEAILSTGAIEGNSFTAAVVGDVLGMSANDVVDWVDDHLIGSPDRPDGLLQEAGWVPVPASDGRLRHLARYSFLSSLVQAAVERRDSASAAAYADALEHTFAAQPHGTDQLIARLQQRAGNLYAATTHQLRADLRADQEVQAEVLERELNAVSDARELGEQWPAWRTLLAATRITLAAENLGEGISAEDAIHSLSAGYLLAQSATVDAPGLDVDVLHAHALFGLARCAYARLWFADALAFSLRARTLWSSFPDGKTAILCATIAIGSYGRLLGLATHGEPGALRGSITRQLPDVPVDDVLPSVDGPIWKRPADTTALLREASDRLVAETAAELAALPRDHPRHLEGEFFLSRSELPGAARDWPAAASLLRQAASEFETCAEGRLCHRVGEAQARLITVLDMASADPDTIEATATAALTALLANAAWWRAANVCDSLARARHLAGDPGGAREALGHGIRLAKMSGERHLEAELWSRLVDVMGADRDAAKHRFACSAMAVVLAQARQRRLVDELEELTRAHRLDKDDIQRLLDYAVEQQNADGAENLLTYVTGVSLRDTQRFLASFMRADRRITAT